MWPTQTGKTPMEHVLLVGFDASAASTGVCYLVPDGAKACIVPNDQKAPPGVRGRKFTRMLGAEPYIGLPRFRPD